MESIRTISRLEDILAWQKARELTKRVYELTRSRLFSRDFGLRDQIRRAAVSAMANVAEGFERGGDREFIQFLSHSKGSSAEVKSLLYAAHDQACLSQEEFDELYALADEVTRLTGGFMKYLQTSGSGGHKFIRPAVRDSTLKPQHSRLND